MHMIHYFLGFSVPMLVSSVLFADAGLPFATSEVRYEEVTQEQVVDAVLEAVDQATVSSQTTGRITEISVDVDDIVPKGHVLLRFRDKEQRAALKAAEAKHSEAEANYSRIQDLLEKKLVSKSEFDKVEAALKGARAALEQAQEQLDHTIVKAPYSGIVVERHVEVGELANPGTRLITGLSLEKLRAVASVSQAHIDQVRANAHARVVLPTQQNKSIDAVKLTFTPFADPASHTFKVRIDLPAGRHGVYPGMYVKATLTIGKQRRLLVDESAVVHRSEVTAVYVVDDQGVISFRHIRSGRHLSDSTIEVLAGLDEGEQVALDPVRAGVVLKKQRSGNRQ